MLGAALALLCAAGLRSPAGRAADIRGTLANGWQRHAIAPKGSQLSFEGVYAGDSGFLAIGGLAGWVSSDGRSWKLAPPDLLGYALSQHIPNLNLARVGMGGGVKGTTSSIKADGPNGGYIAVGSYQPPGQPVTKTRAEVAISTSGRSWREVSGQGKTFMDAAMTDVARGGPGWVAAGRSIGPAPKPVVWTSGDGTHWQRGTTLPGGVVFDEIDRLVRGPSDVLAVANGLDGPARIWASADGIHWQIAPGDPFKGAILQHVTAGGPGYLAAGMQDDDPAVWTSSDGLHWQRAASAGSFPGDLTSLQGIAARGDTTVAVGQYGTAAIAQFGVRVSQLTPSAWMWTPQSSALQPTPVPRRATVDPKLFRLRQADLPAGYVEREFGGWADLCDGGNTLCRYVYNAVGPYGAYETSFGSTGRPLPLTDIESMAIEGSRSNAHALASLGVRLVRWWNRGGTLKLVAAPQRIGQETRVYRGSVPAPSVPPGGRFVVYAVEWRDGKAIGQVYVEQQPSGPASAVETLALNLARAQWRHLQTAHS